MPMPPATGGGAPGATTAGASASVAGEPAVAGAGTTEEPGAAAPMTAAYPPNAWMTDREARRAARRAYRRERRTERDGRAGLIFGSILVIVGVWFLLRRYIPEFEADFLGPVVLIGIGAIVLAGALSRNSGDDSAKPR
jgi:hypothetical protein